MILKVCENTKYIGVNDYEIDFFEGQFTVENGMAYNSYIICDEKTAVLDTVDARFAYEWLNNIENELGEAEPDYLIVQHMEPDHSANITNFMKKYKKAVIVSNAKAFKMMKQFFGTDYSERQLVISDGSSLSLGKHELKFIAAPMVHWPEVTVAYDAFSKTLFSADAFGKFGALDTDEDWACEARRYYFGIVGKYGAQVQSLLKKVACLDIKYICPLHGPILNDDLEYYINLYNIWSSYSVETDGVAVAYTSVYGNTRRASELIAKKLREKGCSKVAVSDLARCDMAEAVEDAFRYGKLVLATTTYNGDIFPFMKTFIEALKERNYQGRTVAFIENGSWAPVAAKVMRNMLEGCKNITFAENKVTVNSALSEEEMAQIEALAEELCK